MVLGPETLSGKRRLEDRASHLPPDTRAEPGGEGRQGAPRGRPQHPPQAQDAMETDIRPLLPLKQGAQRAPGPRAEPHAHSSRAGGEK